MKLKSFEIDAINLLISNEDVTKIILSSPITKIDHTGHGYFISCKHSDLAKDRSIYNKPLTLGVYNEFEMGFVIFIENHEFTLECHGFDKPLPTDIRDCEVKVTVA